MVYIYTHTHTHTHRTRIHFYTCTMYNVHTYKNPVQCEIFMLCLVENFIKFVLIKFVCVCVIQTNENMRFSSFYCMRKKREKKKKTLTLIRYGAQKGSFTSPTHSINCLYMLSFAIFSFLILVWSLGMLESVRILSIKMSLFAKATITFSFHKTYFDMQSSSVLFE